MDATDIETVDIEKSSEESTKIVTPRGRFMRRLMPRKSWHELSPVQKVGNIVTAAIELTLVILALRDLAHRPAEAINGKKRTWAMVTLIQPFGPIIYFIFGRKRAQTPITA
jgi:hypothetical protein